MVLTKRRMLGLTLSTGDFNNFCSFEVDSSLLSAMIGSVKARFKSHSEFHSVYPGNNPRFRDLELPHILKSLNKYKKALGVTLVSCPS